MYPYNLLAKEINMIEFCLNTLYQMGIRVFKIIHYLMEFVTYTIILNHKKLLYIYIRYEIIISLFNSYTKSTFSSFC